MRDSYDLLIFEDLNSDLKMVASACGIDNVRCMLRNFNSMSIYFPKFSYFRECIIRYIRENPDRTIKQIALELDISEQYVKNLIKEHIFA